MAGHRKFIAGAVCPQCQKMDKLYIEDDPAVARCAACGYDMQQASEQDTETTPEKPVDQAVTLVNFKKKEQP